MKPDIKQRWRYNYNFTYTYYDAIVVQVISAAPEGVSCVVVQVIGSVCGHKVGGTFNSPGLTDLYNDKHNRDNAGWVYLDGQEAP